MVDSREEFERLGAEARAAVTDGRAIARDTLVSGLDLVWWDERPIPVSTPMLERLAGGMPVGSVMVVDRTAVPEEVWLGHRTLHAAGMIGDSPATGEEPAFVGIHRTQNGMSLLVGYAGP